MNQEKVFLVAGGDLRQAYLAGLLAEDARVYAIGMGHEVDLDGRVIRVESLDEIGECADYVVLPMPATNDGVYLNAQLSEDKIPLAAVADMARCGSLIFAGKVDGRLRALCESRGLEVIDYLEREELAVMNAVPTAEGTIQILMEELPTTLFSQRCLVTGYGRLSKVLCRLLTALGVDVTVTARKYGDLAWARISGCEAVHISELKQRIGAYDFIINTVPAMLFTQDVLARVKPDSLVIDLASKPGGVDFDMAKNLGVRTIWALSLPGKVAPISSGAIICDTIRNILAERETQERRGEPER